MAFEAPFIEIIHCPICTKDIPNTYYGMDHINKCAWMFQHKPMLVEAQFTEIQIEALYKVFGNHGI